MESPQYEELYRQSGSSNSEDSSQKRFMPPIVIKQEYLSDEKFSSPFFQDHAQQEYQIQRAFQCNNFNYIRNLPTNFKHGGILYDRKAKVFQANCEESFNRTRTYEEKLVDLSEKAKEKKKQQIGTLGYFNIFPYEQSNYDLPKIISREQKKKDDSKRAEISEIDFRPSGFDAKQKYQDPFRYQQKITRNQSATDSSKKQSETSYLFPFHIPQDTYDCFHESELRKKLILDSMKLNGDFIPSQNEQSLSYKVAKSQLMTIVNELEIFLKKYLKDIGFFIGVNKSDHIQILFEEKYYQENKIYMVMSKICEHEMLSKYQLRRYLEKWGKIDKEKGYLLFCMLPPWVKNPDVKLLKSAKSKLSSTDGNFNQTEYRTEKTVGQKKLGQTLK